MIEIYLGKRYLETGKVMDYAFFEYHNGELNYETANASNIENAEKYSDLEDGCIIIENEILTPDNATLEQVAFISQVANEIKNVADELKQSYKPAKFIVANEKTLKRGIVPSLSGFRAWKYITASEFLESFISKYNQIKENEKHKR